MCNFWTVCFTVLHVKWNFSVCFLFSQYVKLWFCHLWVHAFQGEILQEVTLPNKKKTSFTEAMLFWRQLVSNFEPPEEEDRVATLKAHIAYAKSFCKKTQSLMVDDDSNLVAAHNYAISIALTWSAAALQMIFEKPEEPWDIDNMLMPQHRPLVRSLKDMQGMQTKIQDLKDCHDLKMVAAALGMCESASAVLSIAFVNDELLVDVKSTCEKFLAVYEKALVESFKHVENSVVKGLQEFNNKFSPVADAAAEWKMDSVSWCFEAGNEVKSKIEGMHDCLSKAQEAFPLLETLVGHSSSNDKVKEFVTSAQGLKESIKDKRANAHHIASIVMVSGFFKKEDGDDDVQFLGHISSGVSWFSFLFFVHKEAFVVLPTPSSRLETILEHCKKMYHLNFNALPEKLQSMIEEEKKKAKKDGEKKKSSKDKDKEKKPKKEKEVKKDKDTKKEKKEKKK